METPRQGSPRVSAQLGRSLSRGDDYCCSSSIPQAASSKQQAVIDHDRLEFHRSIDHKEGNILAFLFDRQVSLGEDSVNPTSD